MAAATLNIDSTEEMMSLSPYLFVHHTMLFYRYVQWKTSAGIFQDFEQSLGSSPSTPLEVAP